jgi:nucleoside-diphosphate-sugar epimerase
MARAQCFGSKVTICIPRYVYGTHGDLNRFGLLTMFCFVYVNGVPVNSNNDINTDLA